ncbi:GGDEF domain-containing protein [Agaribacterium haliotis]|uniref:GGDEF domain-containing protein n=1 Tax=Agaribacterium haliotis TaxID=2013869 RepID=UPI000BB56AD2|nr:GGDEF domain-containing protein [Agaribacterium haliotis]
MVTLASNKRSPDNKNEYSEVHSGARLDIATRLNSSLDAEEILKQFFSALNTLIRCDGLRYKDESQQVELQIGRMYSHRASYQLTIEDDTLGELCFARRRRFAEAELVSIESLISLLIYPLRNARMYFNALQGSHVDSLSGLRNRRALINCMQHEIPLAQRHNKDLGLLMLDIDHFKQINDQYGHRAGDHCLKHLASLLKQILRAGDQAFRYGGEEFVILLSECDQRNTYFCAERIRSQLSAKAMEMDGTSIALSASIGCANLAPGDDFERLFERADQAMYEAKKRGRNCCVQAHNKYSKNDKQEKKIA